MKENSTSFVATARKNNINDSVSQAIYVYINRPYIFIQTSFYEYSITKIKTITKKKKVCDIILLVLYDINVLPEKRKSL